MTNKELKISKFFKRDYTNFATYDVARKIGNVIDGNKISMRKILWIVHKTNLNRYMKTAQLSSLVAFETNYRHGEQNLPTIIGRFTNNYVGTNNMPLLDSYGIFGNRLTNEMSAPRYTNVKKSKIFDLVYDPTDQKLANRDFKQVFEGDEIEPSLLVPVIPLVLVNGLRGLGMGFSQHILNRNIEDVFNNIKRYIDGKTLKPMNPYFNNFKGTIVRENNKVFIKGVFKRERRKIIITDLPISYDLKKYKEILNDLQDKKIILKYKDYSEDGFLFEISVPKNIYNLSDDELLEMLGLVDKFTENLTFQDKNGKIINFENEIEVFKYFADFRLERYNMRKNYMLDEYWNDYYKFANIHRFIMEKMEGKINIDGLSRKNAEKYLEEKGYSNIDDIMNIKIYHFTKEKIQETDERIRNIKRKISNLKHTTIKELWWEDVKLLKKEVRKNV